MVTNFSAAEKDSGMKLRLLVRLLSGMSFSHFGEVRPRGGSHRRPTSGMIQISPGKKIRVRLGGQSELAAPYGGISVLLVDLLAYFIYSLSQCVRLEHFGFITTMTITITFV